MKRIRWYVVLLVIWLTLLFNIERLDFEQGATVNLASYFYVLIAATAMLFLFLPLRRRQMYLVSLAVLSIYAVFEALDPAASFSGVNKYLTITEIVALVITIGLAWSVSQVLQDFTEAVEAISLPEGRPQLLSFDKLQERIQTEIGRARRHQHPVSVSMLELDPSTFEASLHQAVRDAQAAMTKRYVQARLGVFLAKQIRETDAIASDTKDGRFLILAPQIAATQMTAMLKRLMCNAERQVGARFRYSAADFPTAALTSEELIRKVAEALQNEPVAHNYSRNGAPSEPVEELNPKTTTAGIRRDSVDETEMGTTQLEGKNETGNGGHSHNGNPSKLGDSLVSRD